MFEILLNTLFSDSRIPKIFKIAIITVSSGEILVAKEKDINVNLLLEIELTERIQLKISC